MTRTRLTLIVSELALGAASFRAQTPAPATAYTFTEIAPGVYSALGTGAMNVGSNSAVIVNRDDVLIVDSHISPESARAMVREIKTISSKPITFLVNTHFHYDHASGNQVFGPATDIIGHDYTRKRLAGDILQRHVRRPAERNAETARGPEGARSRGAGPGREGAPRTAAPQSADIRATDQ